MRSGKISRLNWNEKDRIVDVFDAKKDAIQTLIEVGFNRNKIFIDDKTPSYYHPGKSGAIFQNLSSDQPVAFFGEIHPNIIQKLDINRSINNIWDLFR